MRQITTPHNNYAMLTIMAATDGDDVDDADSDDDDGVFFVEPTLPLAVP